MNAKSTSRVDAIVVAAGRGRRFGGGENKVLVELAGRPVWARAVEALRQSDRIDAIILVIRPEDRSQIEPLAEELGVRTVDGGAERYDSVRAGLAEATRLAGVGKASKRWVAVHDAARPLVSPADVRLVVDAALDSGAAILATPIRGTVKRELPGSIETVDRSRLWEALTPQVFRADILDTAYARWRGRPVTDDAEMVERSGIAVTLVPGSPENLKITHADDLAVAQAILSRRTQPPSARS